MPAPEGHTSRSAAPWIGGVCIIICGLVAYSSSLHGEFVFDDITSIVKNEHIRALWPPAYLTAPEGVTVSGRPVVSLTLALNYALAGGLDVFGYHLFNVLAHIATAVVMCRLLAAVFGRLGDAVRVAEGWALAAAAVWVVHPLCTDAVNQVVYRTEVLMSLCYVLTLWCTVRGASSTSRSRSWYVLAVVSCGVGMGCKQNMVSAPLAVLLLDRILLSGSFSEAVRQRSGLYIGLLATYGILFASMWAGRPPETVVGFGIEKLPAPHYWMTQCGVLLHYLRLAVVPVPLVMDYQDWPVATSFSAAAGAILTVGALLCGIALLWRHRPLIGWLLTVALFILAPTSLIPNIGDICGEHRMYLPVAAIVILAVWLWRRLVGWLRPHVASAAVQGLSAAVVIVVVVLGWHTWQRGLDYRTALSAWADVVDKRPTNPTARINLGALLREAGRFDEAQQQLEAGLGLHPRSFEGHYNLGQVQRDLNDLPSAHRHMRAAVELRPSSYEAHVALAEVLHELGDEAGAFDHIDAARRLQPDALILCQQLDNWAMYDQGLACMEDAVDRSPDLIKKLIDRSQALLTIGQVQPALAGCRAVLRRAPDDDAFRSQYARLLLQAAEFDMALVQYDFLLERNAKSMSAWANGAQALRYLGRNTEAAERLKRALAIDHDQPRLHYELALILVDLGQRADAMTHLRQALDLQPDLVAAQAKLTELEQQGD